MKQDNLKHFIFTVSFVAASVLAHTDDQVLSTNTPELGRHIGIEFSLGEIPTMNKPVAAVLQVKNNQSALKQVSIELILPEGIIQTTTLQAKNIAILSPQDTVDNQFNIQALKAGQYKVTAKITAYTGSGQYIDRYDYLYFTVDENPAKSKMGFDKHTDFIDASHSPSEIAQLEIDSDGFVEVAAADEHQNETTRLMPASQYYSNNQIQGGIVTINGRYRFRNRENTDYVGYYRNYLRLFNGATDEFLASTYTNHEGDFTFPSVINTDSDGFRIRVYSVRFLSGGLGYGVCETDNCNDQAANNFSNLDQFYFRQSGVFTAADGNYNAGTCTTGHSLTNTARAMWIKHDMDMAYLHLLQHSSIRGPFTAEWATDSTDGTYYDRDANIHFEADVGDGSNHTVLHEIGHNVMWNAGTFPSGSDCPNPHFTNKISGIQCAWTEGWGYMFVTLVNNSPEICFPPSTTFCRNYDTDSSYDYCEDGWYCGPNSEMVEGHVVGALWDLYDTQNDGFDIESYDIDNIYNILESDTNNSFASWWTSWINDGHSDLALNSLFQNDILYGDMYDIRVNNGTVSNSTPQAYEAFNVTATVRNLGDISSIATNINYYLSNNNTISHFDELLSTKYSGILDKNISRILVQSLTLNTPGSYWVGACFDDPYDFDQEGSNDCTDGIQITVSANNDVIFISGFE